MTTADGRSPLRGVLARHRWVLATGALLALAMLPGLARLQSDNSPEVFFVRDSQSLADWRELQQRFGSASVVRVVVGGDALWTAAGLSWLGEIEEGLAAVPGVEAARGLASRYRRPGAWPPAPPNDFRQRVLTDSLDRELGWVDAAGEIASVLVTLAGPDAASRQRALDGIRQLLEPRPPGLEVDLVGLPVLDEALDGSSKEIEERFFPLLVLAAVILLCAVFRHLPSVAAPLLFVGWAEVMTLGWMGHLGVRLNLVLAVLPPLLFVIALATAVHLLMRYRTLLAQGDGVEEAVLKTYGEKGWAVLWTGLTTLVGFASLATSRVAPVQSLGLWTAVGVGLTTVAAFTLYPALLVSLVKGARQGSRPEGSGGPSLGRRWASWAVTRRRLVLGGAAVVALLAAGGFGRLQVESNGLRYLGPEHPVRRSVEALEARRVGTATVELMLTVDSSAGERPDFRTQGAALAALAERLRRRPEALGVVSSADLTAAAARQALRDGPAALAAGAAGGDALAAFVSRDGAAARVSILTATEGAAELQPLIDAARRSAAEAFPGAHARLTGPLLLILEAHGQLLRTLAVSLGLTVAAITALLWLLLRNGRLTLLAMIPNLWPVWVVLGSMGWLGVPLDSATVMVASVLLGLAVDDTFHTLGHFRRAVAQEGRRGAAVHALERTAPAYLLTGAILIIGFGICGLSDFAPISRFGLLSAGGIALAVINDLFLLPALLSCAPRSALRSMGRL